MPWYYVGQTWFSPSGGSPSPQGYLHNYITPLSGTTCYNSSNVSNGQECSTTSDCTAPYNSTCTDNSTYYNSLNSILNPNADNSPGYMSCTQTGSNANKCPYIINATNTPTAGTLSSALAYFNGQYKNAGVNYASPISSKCQKNYIIFVTDGLPSTLMNGTQTQNLSQLMTEVTTELGDLRSNVSQTFNGTAQTFPVPTYVLGLGLTSEAKTNLDAMAQAGGTLTTSGHAYYADEPDELTTALEAIMVNLLGQVSSGSAISILSQGQTQNGANMLQGVFYPAKYFGTTAITYPGYLYNYWYYSNGQYSNIREDTVHDYILQLNEDYGLTFLFGTQTGLTVDRNSDPSGSGNPTVFVDNVGLDSLTPLWEAGKMLLQTTPDSRQILTPGSNSNGSGLVSFNTSNTTLVPTPPATSPLGNPSTFDSCLQPPGTSNTAILDNLINYVRGTDITNTYCSNAAGTSFSTTPCSPTNPCTTAPYTTCSTLSSCRSRTVGLCSNGTPCNSNSDCTSGSCTENVWKMGDIIYSTPKVQANYSYCYNGSAFNTTPCSLINGNNDCSNSGAYNVCQMKQSVVFVGANDGMLHAFQTGVISTTGLNSSNFQVAELTGIPTSSMGQELWGFIPTNSLPYLRCLASQTGCHLYYNDLSPYITTMNMSQQYCSNATSQTCTQDSDCTSPGTCTPSLRTVLIGGMRLGGAAINPTVPATYCFNSSGTTTGHTCSGGTTSGCPSGYTSSCSGQCLNSSGVPNGQKCSSVSNCTTAPYNAGCSTSSYYYINAPSDTCSNLSSLYSSQQSLCSDTSNSNSTKYNPSNCTGLSEYYALDITDAQNPKLLWEFTHPFLGYTYSGPAVIHKWSSTTGPSGDQYYVMFLSGPTNPKDGSSIQDVKTFVLTLNTTNLGINSVYYKDLGVSTANGFGGRLFTNGLDVNSDGYTDFVLFGYANSPTGSGTGWQGGLGKIFTSKTKTDSNGNIEIDYTATDPSNWTYDVTTYAGEVIQPITASVATEKCFNTLYLYSGTGRYFFPLDNYSGPGLNYLMGIPFTCDQYNRCGNCLNSSGVSNGQACSSTSDCAAPYNLSCSSTINIQNNNLCTQLQHGNFNQAGWQIQLDAASVDGTYLAERMITDPTTSSGNKVYLTTSEPTSDPCGYGGQSRVWGMNCATGAAISDQSCQSYTVADPTGTLYLQTSTGAINKISVAKDFQFENNRATQWFVGIPPENSPPPAQQSTAPAKSGQLMQWIEK